MARDQLLLEVSCRLSESVIKVCAPEESDDFREIARFYLSGGSIAHSEGIGFGSGILPDGLLGILLPLARDAVQGLVDRLSRIAADAGAEVVRRWVEARLAERKADPLSVTPAEHFSISKQQVARAVDDVTAAAKAKGLPDDAAEALGAIMLKRLLVE